MLRIRLSRTGKKGQPSFRIVVAEHTKPVKSNFVDVVGYYNMSRNPRELEVDQDKVTKWIGNGAQPTEHVAVLLKSLGMANMDKYIKRNMKLKNPKKNPSEAEIAAMEAANAPKAEVTEAPAEEPAPEAPAEEATPEVAEAPVEEPAPEAPAEEEAPKEATTEEAPAEEAAPADADADKSE